MSPGEPVPLYSAAMVSVKVTPRPCAADGREFFFFSCETCEQILRIPLSSAGMCAAPLL